MRRSSLFLIGLLIILTGLLIHQPVKAQQPTPSDDDVNELARQLYCPVCENTPLDVCPTKACAQWREMIREKIMLGWSEDEIKKYFAEQYGEQVLSSPSINGPNRMIYVVPFLLFIAGGVFSVMYIRSLLKRTSLAGVAKPQELPDNDPYLARVEEELTDQRKP
jgi:cytochrome c-type biogenesis protein CcmH